MTVNEHADEQENLVLEKSNPWPGLQVFSENNAEFFHGRSKEIQNLKNLVISNPLTVLFGKSGLGKSSLLQAGISPELRKEHFVPVYIRLNHFEETLPLEDQVEVFLEKTIDKYDIDAPRPIRKETLWEYFHKVENDWWSKDNELLKPILIFDQFEEIITSGQQNSVRSKRCSMFLEELEDLVENRPPKELLARFSEEKGLAKKYALDRLDYRVVISLREDYLADFEGLRERLRSIMSNRIRLLPLNEAQAEEVILKPGGDLIDKDVASKIIEYVAGHSSGAFGSAANSQSKFVEPALLCVILRELNNQRLTNGEAKISAALLEQKRPESIMHDLYKEGIAGLPTYVREFIQENLLTASGARNRVSEDDAIQRFKLNQDIISTLVNRRIIQRERISNITWLELTHDTLVPVVKFNADIDRRRHKIKKRIIYSTIGAAIVIGLLVSALLVQFRVQEQQTLAAAKVAVKLSDTLRESQSMSDELRQKFASVLDQELQGHIETIPDSHLVMAEYTAFQLNSAKSYIEQGRYHLFDNAINSARELYRNLDKSQLTPLQRTKLSIELHLYYAQQSIFKEQFDDALVSIIKVQKQLENPLVEKGLLATQWELQAEFLSASISDRKHNILTAVDKYANLKQKLIDLLESHQQSNKTSNQNISDNKYRQEMRKVYKILFDTLEKYAIYNKYVEINLAEIVEQFERYLSGAKEFFSGEYSNTYKLQEARLERLKFKWHLKQKRFNKARLSINASITDLNELATNQPEHLSFYFELLSSLSQRMEFSSQRDKKQVEEDLAILNKLSNYIAGSAQHPASFCSTLLDSAYWSLRFEKEQINPDEESVFKQAMLIAEHCESEYGLPFKVNAYKLSFYFFMIQSLINSKDVGSHMLHIRALQENGLGVVNKLEQLGASRAYTAERRSWLYITSNNYLKKLSNEEVIELISTGLATTKDFLPEMMAEKSGNISWLMASKAQYYVSLGEREKAVDLFSELIRFGIRHFDTKETTLINNTIWAVTQIVKQGNESENVDMLMMAKPLVKAVIEELGVFEASNHPEIYIAVQRYWKDTLSNIKKAESSSYINAINDEAVLRKFSQLTESINQYSERLESLISEANTTEWKNNLSDAFVNLKQLDLDQISEGQDDAYTSEYPVGWVTRSAYISPDSITLSGNDASINSNLRRGDKLIQRVRYNGLPFYKECRLVVAEYLNEHKENFQLYYLENTNTNQLYRLDGSSLPIHEANTKCGKDLTTRESTTAYLRFFCSFVHSNRGAFFLVESIEELKWIDGVPQEEKLRIQNLIRPTYVWKDKEDEDWRAVASVNYGDDLFYAEFKIQSTGMVSMIKDRPIVADLNVNSFSIAPSSGRTSNFTNRLLLPALDSISDSLSIEPWLDHILTLPLEERRQHEASFILASKLFSAGAQDTYRHDDILELISGWLEISDAKTEAKIIQTRDHLYHELCRKAAEPNYPYYESLSFCQLFAGQHEAALKTTETGMADASESLNLLKNKAHALLFIGRIEQAMGIYQQNIGVAMPYSSKNWEEQVLDDFKQMESIKISHPGMDKVRQLFESFQSDEQSI